MRTRSQRIDARADAMDGVNDRDATIVQAILELCATIDDASERVAEAHDETRQAIERMSDAVERLLKQSTFVR
jgi:hypothetical protein